MRSKKRCQRQHTQQRASMRYGLTVGKKDYDDLCSRIKSGDGCVFLEKQSNRVSMWAVSMDGEWVPVIYDKIRHSVVTFLPPEALEPFRDKIDGSKMSG